MEPFDEVLNHQVYALEEERMAWEKTVSEYRRNGPVDLRQLTQGMLKHEQAIEYHGTGTADTSTELDEKLERKPCFP